jgi:hypothetical protein
MRPAYNKIRAHLARAIDIRLTDAESARLKRTPAAKPDAEDLALQCDANARKAGWIGKEADAAYALCEQALAIDPNNVRALMNLGAQFLTLWTSLADRWVIAIRLAPARPAENVIALRGTCEQWIKEGKGAIRWARLSCRSFAANAVRLQLHALAYNLGNFLRTLATPEPIKDGSLTSLKEKLIKIGAKVVSHGRYVAFQMAEVAIPRNLFADILRLIAELRPPPVTSTA